MSNIQAFDSTKNKHSLYFRKESLKKFCVSQLEYAADVITFEKKKILPLAEKELKSHQDTTNCYVSRKKLTQNLAKDKNQGKFRDHCHFTGKYRGAQSIFKLRFNAPNKIPVLFNNGSNYDKNFIME